MDRGVRERRPVPCQPAAPSERVHLGQQSVELMAEVSQLGLSWKVAVLQVLVHGQSELGAPLKPDGQREEGLVVVGLLGVVGPAQKSRAGGQVLSRQGRLAMDCQPSHAEHKISPIRLVLRFAFYASAVWLSAARMIREMRTRGIPRERLALGRPRVCELAAKSVIFTRALLDL